MGYLKVCVNVGIEFYMVKLYKGMEHHSAKFTFHVTALKGFYKLSAVGYKRC
jgi:hypothetical protein